MMTVGELRAWLAPLHEQTNVAIDEGGLTLVELYSNNQPSQTYLEIGGIPDDESFPIKR